MEERDQTFIGISTPIEGGDNFANNFFQNSIELPGEDKEEEVVGEEGDNKDIDVEDARKWGEKRDAA